MSFGFKKPTLSGPEMMIRGLIGAESFDAMKQMVEGGAMTKFLEFVEQAGTFKLRLERIESQLLQTTMEFQNVRQEISRIARHLGCSGHEQGVYVQEQRSEQSAIEPGSTLRNVVGLANRHSENDFARHAGNFGAGS